MNTLSSYFVNPITALNGDTSTSSNVPMGSNNMNTSIPLDYTASMTGNSTFPTSGSYPVPMTVQPSMTTQPPMTIQPSMTTQPLTDMQPSMTTQPLTDMQPSMTTQPQMTMPYPTITPQMITSPSTNMSTSQQFCNGDLFENCFKKYGLEYCNANCKNIGPNGVQYFNNLETEEFNMLDANNITYYIVFLVAVLIVVAIIYYYMNKK